MNGPTILELHRDRLASAVSNTIGTSGQLSPLDGSGTHRAGLGACIHGAASQKFDRVCNRCTRHQDAFGMTRAVALFPERIELLHQDFAIRSDQKGGKGVVSRLAGFGGQFD